MAAENNLSDYVDNNIDSMVSGMKHCSTDDDLLVYKDQKNETPELLRITKKANGEVVKETVKCYTRQNSVSSTVMESVLSDMVNYAVSDKYSLILWSHGDGWFPSENSTNALTRYFGTDDNYGSKMNISDLVTALNSAPHFDTILFDACFMGGVETDYALRKNADYIIASPTEVMGDGFPYQSILASLFGETEKDYIAAATAYYTYYKSLPITTSSYPSATVGCVKCSELDSLAVETAALIKPHATALNSFDATSVQHLEGYSPHLFYDLGDFVKAFTTESERSAFEAELNRAVVYEASTSTILSVTPGGNQYVEINAFSGLNTYIPQSGMTTDYTAYRSCDWFTAAGWNNTNW